MRGGLWSLSYMSRPAPICPEDLTPSVRCQGTWGQVLTYNLFIFVKKATTQQLGCGLRIQMTKLAAARFGEKTETGPNIDICLYATDLLGAKTGPVPVSVRPFLS